MAKVDPIYLNELLDKLITIDNTFYSNPKDKDGDIGERFVKDSIKYYMWDKGFKLRSTGNRTFKIDKPPKKGKKGADFPFCFTHNSIVYDCYVESKNWDDKYRYITDSTFKKEILDRFIKKANQQGCIWIVTMNKANIPLINQRCQQHNILIIPMDMKITTTQLNTASFTPIIEHFLDDFDKLMTHLIHTKLRKPAKQLKTGSKPYDKAIILGLPSDLIAKVYGTTPKNVEKRRSELKSQGEDILDWRSSTAKRAKLITKDQLDYIRIDIIISMIEKEENK